MDDKMATEIRLPELAEGVDKGDVLHVFVSEGDSIDVDAPVAEIESGKATVTIPSPAKGRVGKVHIKPGDSVSVGDVLIELEEHGAQAGQPEAQGQAPVVEAAPKPAGTPEPVQSPEPTPASERMEEDTSRASEAAVRKVQQGRADASGRPLSLIQLDRVIPAGPAVRRIARELNVRLEEVKGSGPNGRILVEDLNPYIHRYIAEKGGAVADGMPGARGHGPVPPLPDFSKWGPVRREKVTSLRRKIAENMARAWATIPHVHQMHEADITAIAAVQKHHREQVKQLGGNLTLTPFVLKAIVATLKEYPLLNCSYDPATEEVIYKDYYHIGVAVDTEAGLVVPVVRDVDKKTVVQLAVELAQLAERTRQRKISPDDLAGATFTVSNLGSIGGGAFTPIINAPQVAILGTARAVLKPVWTGEAFQPREIMPLCLGYDHRVIDGALGARFITRLVQLLENHEMLFLGM